MNIAEILKNLGLNDKEIQVYLALLQVGSVPASLLGKRTGITRSTAQYTCQQLEKKGLIKAIQKNNTFIYSPEPPEKLLFLLDNQKKEISEKEEQVNRILSTLKGMINPQAVLPKVKFYEGLEGMRNAYDELINYLEPGIEILSFAKVLEKEIDRKHLKDTNKTTEFIKHGPSIEFIKKRIELKIPIKNICTYSKEAKLLKKYDKESFRETRLVDKVEMDFLGGELFIIKDRIYVAAVDSENEFMYMVENKSMVQMYKSIFNLAWERAKEIDKKLIKTKPLAS